MTLPPGPKVTFAPQDAVDQLQPQIDALLEILGHPEAWASDESLICDFMDFGLNGEECQAEIERLCTVHQLPAKLHAGMTLVEACRALLEENPHWPGPRSIQ